MVLNNIGAIITKNLKCILSCLLLSAIIAGIALYFLLDFSPKNSDAQIRAWVYPEPMKAEGAVVSNGGPCAAVGSKILKKYGNAVASLIATMLCDGVVCMPFMGAGGGFMATVYIKNESKVETLIARETAPAAATVNMFANNSKSALIGGLSVGVPGELMGHWELHKKYGGGVPWQELFVDAIALAREGVTVSKKMAAKIVENKEEILAMPGLRKVLQKSNGEFLKEGDKFIRPKLAETLELVAKYGPNVLYNGSLTAGFVKDIRDNGGIITEQDMNSYRVRWEKPIHVKLTSGINFYSVGPPASGHLLGFILRVLDNTLKQDMDTFTNISAITETFKFTYGMRSHFGDPHYINISQALDKINDEGYIASVREKIFANRTSNNQIYYGAEYYQKNDFGTANIAVIGPNGDAVSATSTINHSFGSRLISESTGILLNDQMDDFSTPGLVNGFDVRPSPSNFIAPGKRPQSSTCPSIFINENGDVRLVVGAAGGPQITTSVALTIIRNMWENKPISEAVEEPRFHHQLMPMEWKYEATMPQKIISAMKARGHNTSVYESSAVVTAITKNGNMFGVASDMRRPGNTSFLAT